jgi:hypothetical protein
MKPQNQYAPGPNARISETNNETDPIPGSDQKWTQYQVERGNQPYGEFTHSSPIPGIGIGSKMDPIPVLDQSPIQSHFIGQLGLGGAIQY